MLISKRSVVGSPDGNTNYCYGKNFFWGGEEICHEARDLKAAYVHHAWELQGDFGHGRHVCVKSDRRQCEPVFYRGARRKRKDSAKRFGKRENTPQAGQCEKAYAGEDADAEGLFREVFHPRKLSTSIQS